MTRLPDFYRLISFALLCSATTLFGQNDHRHVYLVGNPANTSTEWVDLLIDDIKQSKVPSSVYLLGDLTDENGINKKPKSQNKKRLKSYKKIEKETNAKIYFLSGDRDWDNSGDKGKKKVNHLEKYLEKDLKLKKRFIPSQACPGPHLIEEGDRLVVIAINSQWFIHPHDRPEAPDTDCSIVFEADFWEELDELIEDAKNKNVLIVAHHPIYSFGQHDGEKLGLKHLIPFYGTLYSSYRKNIGGPTDLAYPRYQNYIDKMRDLLQNHNSLIYASGHDHYNSIVTDNNNFFINTSINKDTRAFKKKPTLKFASSNKAYVKLRYGNNGSISSELRYLGDKNQPTTKVIPLFGGEENSKTQVLKNYRREKPELPNTETKDTDAQHSTPVAIVAGPEYATNEITKRWMGKNYRNEWTKEVSVPTLNLQTQHGGLRPYARGGGLQTNSLKFRGSDGQNYVFRAVNKNPERALDELLKQTIYRRITKQLITTQHPYGGLVAAELLDATDILHASPTLYVMPDDPSLGIYREAFANILGFLEIKPKTLKKKKGTTFGNADAIVSTHQMLRAMNNSNKHRMDPLSYAKARVFDMWIGDWDKHEDNWKWALFKEDGKSIYKPIPRDRDHVFSKWEGVIPRIADKVIPNAENFGYDFGNLSQLNYKACNLDRRFGVEVTAEQWEEAALYIQTKMTDQLIDQSLDKFPAELNQDRTIEIREKLINRRAALIEMIRSYQIILFQNTNILGSNKNEHFNIQRLANGDVALKIYERSAKGKIKDLIHQQVIRFDKTNVLYIYGLGGADRFDLEGKVANSMKIRIIPGVGKDEIYDNSSAKGSDKKSQIYQGTKENDLIQLSDETSVKRPFHRAAYDYHSYHLDRNIPFVSFQYGGYRKLGIALDFKKIKQGFNKPDFAKIHRYKIKYFPSISAYRAQYEFSFRHLFKDWDFNTKHIISDEFDKYPNFLGEGTTTLIDDDLQDENYYRIDFDTYRAKIGMQKSFLFKSQLAFYINYEFNEVSKLDDIPSILDEVQFTNLQGIGTNHSLDLESELKLDFRDHKSASHQGSLLNFNHRLYRSLSKDNWGGHMDFRMSHYETFSLKKKITIIGRIGSINTYGDLPFYQRSTLGANNYLRGFNRNRFLGNHAAYYNLESRLELGTWYNILAPITYGVFGFHDQGSVWNNFSELNKGNQWRKTFGLGVFAAPLSRDFTFSLSYARSDEQEGYLNFEFGFELNNKD